MRLLLKSSEVRIVFDLRALDTLLAPSLPILFAMLSKLEMKQHVLPLRLSEVRDVLHLSALDNMDFSLFWLFQLDTVKSEQRNQQQVYYNQEVFAP
jgi:hypothetical protein